MTDWLIPESWVWGNSCCCHLCWHVTPVNITKYCWSSLSWILSLSSEQHLQHCTHISVWSIGVNDLTLGYQTSDSSSGSQHLALLDLLVLSNDKILFAINHSPSQFGQTNLLRRGRCRWIIDDIKFQTLWPLVTHFQGSCMSEPIWIICMVQQQQSIDDNSILIQYEWNEAQALRIVEWKIASLYWWTLEVNGQ